MFVGDFGQQLDEVERPAALRRLGLVRQAVIPRLEFIEQKCCGFGFEEFEQQVDAWYVRPARAPLFPLAFDVSLHEHFHFAAPDLDLGGPANLLLNRYYSSLMHDEGIISGTLGSNWMYNL